VLFLDTRPLHAVLMQNVVMLEQKIRSQPMSERTPRRTEQLTLLNKLAAQVDPEFKPFARRGERTAAVGIVDAIVGFPKIAGYLREEERDPIPRIDTSKSFGGTMELAVFGHMRNEPDKRAELSRRRLAAYAMPGGPWEVKDMSQTGFRLIAPMSVANAVTLGTLAAIRPPGQTLWSLGIVRRMRRLTTDRAEIGLQVIANTLAGVDIVEQRKGVEEYSVDGEETTINGRTFPGLYLVLRKREGENTVQSLIVPASEYHPAKRYKVMTSKSVYPIRFGRLIEQMSDWVWATVEPHGSDRPLPVMPGTTISPSVEGHSANSSLPRNGDATRPNAQRRPTGNGCRSLRGIARRLPLGRPSAFQYCGRLLPALGGRSHALRAVLGRRVGRALGIYLLGPAAAGEPPVECARGVGGGPR
jgi:hypothetical protein